MKKITSDFSGSEDDATRLARIMAVHDGYFGAGAAAAALHLGGCFAALNPMLAAPVAEAEAFGSWGPKMNLLNQPVGRLVAAIFTGPNDVLFDFTDPVGNYSDTGGTVQITHNTPLARANSLVNAVNHQQATTSLRGLWMTDVTGGWYRPDQTDDLFSFNLPSAVTGTLILVGRTGCYFETRDAALGATVNVGWLTPHIRNGTYGKMNILEAVGDVLAIGFKEGALTDDQKLHIARAFRPFGGGGIWTLEPELLTNTTYTNTTNLTLGTGWAHDAGNGRAVRAAGSTQGVIRENPGALVTDDFYNIEMDFVSIATAGYMRLQLVAGSALTSTTKIIITSTALAGRRISGVQKAVAGDDGMGVYGASATDVVIDNPSMRRMTKGW